MSMCSFFRSTRTNKYYYSSLFYFIYIFIFTYIYIHICVVCLFSLHLYIKMYIYIYSDVCMIEMVTGGDHHWLTSNLTLHH